ncbi:MAG: hypothetical protein J6A43_02640 [Clostridia bacterium]|nr:hypothetical protein [Clostridia bacterium]
MDVEKRINFTDKVIHGILQGFSNAVKDGSDYIPVEAYVPENFFEGTKKFLKNPSKNGKWSLGYANINLTPLDYANRNYYMGGYISPDNGFKNLIEEVVDAMKGRAIALDDGSGRGVSVFCTIDCIGTTNGDIRVIRKKFKEKFEELYPDRKIASVNVFSTHTHSCVDTEGIWTDFPGKLLRNFKRKKKGNGALERGADEQYMRFLCEGVSDTLIKAVQDMCEGELTIAQKDITEDYFSNRNRPSAPSIVTDITRLTFTPDDKSKTPTMIINLPAHPDVAGFPVKDEPGSGRRLSGDYVYYLGETVGKAGYNLMFFNGAICAIYMARGKSNDDLKFNHRYEESIRFGREIGRIALSLTKTLDEIKKDKLLYDEAEIVTDTELAKRNGGNYTLWCEGWEPVEEKKVKPLLNIRIKEVKIPIMNPLMAAAGKLKLANFKVLTEGKGKYAIYSEIGYIEFGKELKVAMVPGEFCCDLLKGGASLYADGSITHTDFGLPSVRDIFGEDTIAFGLANDAIGYIVPDNDYTMGDPMNHYHELVSLGCLTGSSVMKGFVEMAKELEIK